MVPPDHVPAPGLGMRAAEFLSVLTVPARLLTALSLLILFLQVYFLTVSFLLISVL